MRAHRDMIVTPKILPGGSAKLRWAGRGTGDLYFIASVVQRKEKTLDVGGPSSIYFIYIFGGWIRNSEAATSGGGRAAPRLACQWARKDGCAQRTGAHSRPKPTSLSYIHLGSSVCHPVVLSYSCHPVVLSVVVAERWAILYVLVIKLTKETRRRVSRGRD